MKIDETFHHAGDLLVTYAIVGRDGGQFRITRCGDDAAFVEAGPNLLLRNDGPCVLDLPRIEAMIAGLQRFRVQIQRANDREMLTRNNDRSRR